MTALSEVAQINPKLSAQLAEDEPVSFLGMAEVSEGGITGLGEVRPYSAVKKGYTPFLDGDLLVAKITPCFENGKIAQAKTSRPYAFGSTEFHVIRVDETKADSRYVLHLLRSPAVRLGGERRMTGSAGQRRVPKAFLETLQVPLPSLPEQRRLASILDQANELRTQRRRALALLNEFVSARFVQMFGYPGQSAWPIGKVGDLLESATYGTSAKAGSEGAFPVLRMGNISRIGDIDMRDLKYLDLDASVHSKHLVHAGDVLFNRTNSAELVGKSAVYRGSNAIAYAGYLVRLRVSDRHDSEFLGAFLNSAYAKRQLRSMAKSIVGMANINAKEVQELLVPVPTLESQKVFAAQVAAVEAAKLKHLVHLNYLDELFASLQHRALRGEL